MHEKNSFAESVSNFVSGKGFYIILALCAAAIGASGYVLFFTGDAQKEITAEPLDPPKIEAPVVKKEEIPIPPKPAVKPEEPKPAAKADKPKAAKASKKEDTVPAKAPIVAEKFISPVASREPSKMFTAGELAFDETMSDWRAHVGADFDCPGGDKVCAIGDGKVTKIFHDELAGYCITIDHGNGVISTCRGLMKNATVKEGAKVKMGEVIGGAGEMPCESKQASHIHLEVTKDGKLIDPMSLIGK